VGTKGEFSVNLFGLVGSRFFSSVVIEGVASAGKNNHSLDCCYRAMSIWMQQPVTPSCNGQH